MAGYRGKYQRPTRRRPFLWLGIGCGLLALLCGIFVGKFLLTSLRDRQERSRAIAQYVVQPTAPPETTAPSQPTAPSQTELPQQTAPETTQPTTQPTEPPPPPRFPLIDFEGMWEKNPDVVAWLHIPALEVVHYPVVQGGDNAHYVNHSWDGKERESGAIFLDFRNQGDFSQVHNILYGHCMKDGTMFQSLGKWERDSFYDTKDRTVLLYLPEETRVYEIFAVERVNALNSRVYKTDYEGDDAWLAALEETLRCSQKRTAPALSADAEVLTLSTCIGDMDRLVVHALCLEHVPVGAS